MVQPPFKRLGVDTYIFFVFRGDGAELFVYFQVMCFFLFWKDTFGRMREMYFLGGYFGILYARHASDCKGANVMVFPRISGLVSCRGFFGVALKNPCLGGGFKHFLFSPRNLGKITILTNIFQRG